MPMCGAKGSRVELLMVVAEIAFASSWEMAQCSSLHLTAKALHPKSEHALRLVQGQHPLGLRVSRPLVAPLTHRRQVTQGRAQTYSAAPCASACSMAGA